MLAFWACDKLSIAVNGTFATLSVMFHCYDDCFIIIIIMSTINTKKLIKFKISVYLFDHKLSFKVGVDEILSVGTIPTVREQSNCQQFVRYNISI
jgi:hypothetical protein